MGKQDGVAWLHSNWLLHCACVWALKSIIIMSQSPNGFGLKLNPKLMLMSGCVKALKRSLSNAVVCQMCWIFRLLRPASEWAQTIQVRKLKSNKSTLFPKMVRLVSVISVTDLEKVPREKIFGGLYILRQGDFHSPALCVFMLWQELQCCHEDDFIFFSFFIIYY